MVSVKLILLAVALLALLQADAAGRRHRPGHRRHPEGDEPATFYYLVRCGEVIKGATCPLQATLVHLHC